MAAAATHRTRTKKSKPSLLLEVLCALVFFLASAPPASSASSSQNTNGVARQAIAAALYVQGRSSIRLLYAVRAIGIDWHQQYALIVCAAGVASRSGRCAVLNASTRSMANAPIHRKRRVGCLSGLVSRGVTLSRARQPPCRLAARRAASLQLSSSPSPAPVAQAALKLRSDG